MDLGYSHYGFYYKFCGYEHSCLHLLAACVVLEHEKKQNQGGMAAAGSASADAIKLFSQVVEPVCIPTNNRGEF